MTSIYMCFLMVLLSRFSAGVEIISDDGTKTHNYKIVNGYLDEKLPSERLTILTSEAEFSISAENFTSKFRSIKIKNNVFNSSVTLDCNLLKRNMHLHLFGKIVLPPCDNHTRLGSLELNDDVEIMSPEKLSTNFLSYKPSNIWKLLNYKICEINMNKFYINSEDVATPCTAHYQCFTKRHLLIDNSKCIYCEGYPDAGVFKNTTRCLNEHVLTQKKYDDIVSGIFGKTTITPYTRETRTSARTSAKDVSEIFETTTITPYSKETRTSSRTNAKNFSEIFETTTITPYSKETRTSARTSAKNFSGIFETTTITPYITITPYTKETRTRARTSAKNVSGIFETTTITPYTKETRTIAANVSKKGEMSDKAESGPSLLLLPLLAVVILIPAAVFCLTIRVKNVAKERPDVEHPLVDLT